MKIDINNQEKIESVLNSVNRKARNLDFEDIKEMAEMAENFLNKNNIPKKYRQGSVIWNIEYLPNSYKYSGYYTYVSLIKGKEKWFMKDCNRSYCVNKKNGHRSDYKFAYSKKAVEWLSERIKDFYIL